MKKKILFKTLFIVLAVVLIFELPGYAYATNEPYSTQKLAQNETKEFINEVKGYRLLIPADMIPDMSNSSVVTVLKNDSTEIEIYKQSLQGVSKAGYINYSNKFTQNRAHRMELNAYVQTTNSRINENVHVLKWTREKAKAIPKDLNNYLCFDIQAGGFIYSIFIKSENVIKSYKDYMYMVNSFMPVMVTRAAETRKSVAGDIAERGWNEETLAFYNKYFIESDELTWGIFEPDTSALWDEQLKKYEEYLDYSFPVLLNYSEFSIQKHKNLKNRLNFAWSMEKVLELTLQTAAIEGGNMMYDILNGDYDEFLYDYAKVIEEFGHPVLFRPLNEMNGDWCVYSAYHTGKDTRIYREVYKYIYRIFEEQGANKNTIWIWNPNEGSFPNFVWNHMLMYYPGDEYVDIVGMTAYNTGTYYSYIGETWKEFYELYDELYEEYCSLFAQPLMITEFACASTGGDKAKWITDMFEQIDKYERIKMAIWWDGCDWDSEGNIARSYFLDETPEILKAFKDGLKKPWWMDLYA